MIMTQTHLSEEAYHLARQYELGEPIRVYQATPMRFRTFGLMAIGFSCFLSGIIFVASGFHIKPIDYLLYGMFPGLSILGCLPAFIVSRKTQDAAVYVYSTGFIARNKKQKSIIHWSEIAEVTPKAEYTSCEVKLTNETSIKLNPNIKRFRFLAVELELKARLSTHPEMALEIEQQFERVQNDPPWLQQAQLKANRYQEIEHYLQRKDPEEAFKLGEDYQLGTVLGRYRPTWQSVFIPNANTGGECLFLLILTGTSTVALIGHPLSWSTFTSIIPFLTGTIVCIGQLRVIWNTRLYCYEEGLIYIQPGSLSVIKWEQVVKTTCTQPAAVAGPLATLHLEDNDKIAISKYLDKTQSIKQMLRERTLYTEISASKSRKTKQKREQDS